MNSVPLSPRRYLNPSISGLVHQLNEQARTQEIDHIRKIKQDRKMHHSSSLGTSHRNQNEKRPAFNNRTKEGELIDGKVKLVPYVFIPKYKNQTFIMPNRVFERGPAGKRFFIKMKDTSIYSFKDPQSQKVSGVLHKEDKQKTIISRKAEEFNRILDANDGRKRADHNRWFLKTRKLFHPTHTGQFFSRCEPLLEPREPQTHQIKKVSLTKTFDFKNKWTPISRGHNGFSATASNSVYEPTHHYSASVR